MRDGRNTIITGRHVGKGKLGKGLLTGQDVWNKNGSREERVEDG